MKKKMILVFLSVFSLSSFIVCKKTELIEYIPPKKTAPKPPAGGDAKTSSFKAATLLKINELRRKGCQCGTVIMPPVPELSWNDQLENAARAHAMDMSAGNYFGHASRNGKTPKDRAILAGYTLQGFRSYAFGENIAFGYHSMNEVLEGWIKSPKHCENLMNANFKEVGVAEYNTYWVQDFGARVK